MNLSKDNITAVILAAGQGTRMKSSQPKVLHQILGRPMIAYLLDTLREAGVNDIVVVVGHQAEAVKEALKDYEVRFVIQEPQLGTGHAVQVAMPAVPAEAATVMVLCGDAPLISGESIAALQQLHDGTGAAVTVQTIELPDGAHYGRVVRDESGQVAAVVQAKDSHDRPDLLAIREINTGAYCFDAAFLVDGLTKIPKSPVTGEIYLTDLIHIAREQGRGVEALIDPDWEALLGINSRAELAGATQTVKRRINARHMDQGVTLIDPEATYIESFVSIGKDTVIYPNVYLQGRTVIGENCRIEASVKIVDSILENDVYVKMGCVITQSRVGAGVDIGPFAHLRPLSDLQSGGARRQFRGSEKIGPPRRRQGRPSHLPGRCGHRGRHQRGGRDHHLQLRRREEAPHHHRRGRLHRQQHRPGGAGDRGRRGLHRGRLHHHQGRAAGQAGHLPGPPGKS